MNINRRLTNSMLKQMASSSNYEYRKLLLYYLKQFNQFQLDSAELMEEIRNTEKLKTVQKDEEFLKEFLQYIDTKQKKLDDKEDQTAAIKFKNSNKEKLKMAYSRYYTAKKKLEDDKERDRILKLVQSGYKKIDELREAITGQKTSYRVAFSKVNDGCVAYYEREVSLQDILDLSKLEVTQRDLYKLRLYLSAEKRDAWLQDKSTMDITDSYSDFLTLLSQNSNTIGNEGNKYEMYRKFTIAKQSLLKLGKSDADLLEEIRQEVLSNSKSFIKGVDHTYFDYSSRTIKFESLKSFMGSNPSLASLNTIIKGFNSIEKIINTSIDYTPTEIQKQLQEVMPPEQLEAQIQAQVQQQMQLTIPNLVQQTFMESGFGAYVMGR